MHYLQMELVEDLKEGFEMVRDAIESGRAKEHLELIKRFQMAYREIVTSLDSLEPLLDYLNSNLPEDAIIFLNGL